MLVGFLSRTAHFRSFYSISLELKSGFGHSKTLNFFCFTMRTALNYLQNTFTAADNRMWLSMCTLRCVSAYSLVIPSFPISLLCNGQGGNGSGKERLPTEIAFFSPLPLLKFRIIVVFEYMVIIYLYIFPVQNILH